MRAALPRSLCLFVLFVLPAAFASQVATNLDQVKRIYVGSFGKKADGLRESLIAEIAKHHRLTLVDSPGAADAILKGSGEVWIRGYYSLNPRVHEPGEGATPVYGGFLSVELTGKQDEPLWSWLVTPSRTGSSNITHDLAVQIVRKLDQSVAASPHRP